jgi:hypothetical protein
MSAAREQRLGLSVVASLLGRDDDERLWAEVMAGQPTEDVPATPVRCDQAKYSVATRCRL